ncbi:MAG: hypothetical protein J5556_00935 [Deltaproteobacteria bacterium]|nr:hypothetical protein [Deltaproteobacteria bacterium]
MATALTRRLVRLERETRGKESPACYIRVFDSDGVVLEGVTPEQEAEAERTGGLIIEIHYAKAPRDIAAKLYRQQNGEELPEDFEFTGWMTSQGLNWRNGEPLPCGQ